MIRGMGYYRRGRSEHVEECQALVGDIRGDGGDSVLRTRLQALLDLVRLDDDPDSFLWLGIVAPTRPELTMVAQALGLDELQVDDALNPQQRAKSEIDDGRAFVVFKVLDYLEATSDVETGQVAVFTGPGYVVTVRHGAVSDLRAVRARMESRQDLMAEGPTAVLYAVLDAVVDQYVAVADEVARDIEQVEESVFSPRRSDDSEAIYRLKRENLELRRAVAPLVPTAHRFVAREHPGVPDGLRPWFHDIGDHLLRVWDSIEAADQLLMTMLMAATSRQDLQQNSDMRRISAWVAIAAVPTMIAGVYGMNFDQMPELHWQYGYLLVVGVMATACGLMYRAFRRSGWL